MAVNMRRFRPLLSKSTGFASNSILVDLLSCCQRALHTGISQGPPAFVFDIDGEMCCIHPFPEIPALPIKTPFTYTGVLIRGDKVLQPAKAALQRLYQSGGNHDKG